jgi:uncharacterized protein involved in exopolysaccharide biosynthesis
MDTKTLKAKEHVMEPLEIIETRARCSLRDFLHVVFKRRTEIILFFAVTVIIVALGTLLAKPTYEATSQILVKIGRENLYVPPSSNMTPVINSRGEEQINSEIEILKSQPLAKEVVALLGPTTIYQELKDESPRTPKTIDGNAQALQTPVDKAVLKLQKNLTVEGIKKSNVIEIRFKHKDPYIAAVVTNNLVDRYLDHHLEAYKTPESSEFFGQQSQILRNELNRAEEKLEAFKKRHDLTSLDEERSLLLKEEASLRAASNQTLSQVAKTENRLGELKKQMTATPRTISQGETINHNPYLINALETQLVGLELEKKELLAKYTEESRLVQNVNDEIRMVQQKLGAYESKRYESSSSGLNATYQLLQEEIFRNEAELKALKAEMETQKTQLTDYKESLEKLNKIEVELNQLQQEVDVDRQSYQLYLKKFEEARISNAMDMEKITNVSVLQPASRPLKPVSPKVLLNMVISFILGITGGLGLALFIEYLDDSFEKPEDAEDVLQTPVLASIPMSLSPLLISSGIQSEIRNGGHDPSLKLPTILVLVAGFMFAMGYFPGDSHSKLQEGKSCLSDTVSSNIITAQINPDQTRSLALPEVHDPVLMGVEVAFASDSDEKVESNIHTLDNQIYDNKKPAGVIEETDKVEKFTVQVGALREMARAARLNEHLQCKGLDVHVDVQPFNNTSFLYRVKVGPYATRTEARQAKGLLKKEGFEDCFIVYAHDDQRDP